MQRQRKTRREGNDDDDGELVERPCYAAANEEEEEDKGVETASSRPPRVPFPARTSSSRSRKKKRKLTFACARTLCTSPTAPFLRTSQSSTQHILSPILLKPFKSS